MKRGPKPKNTIKLKWSPRFAYAVGLFTADGCLQRNGRHLNFTSVDKAQVRLFQKCLGLKTKLGIKYSGSGNPSYQTQFGNVLLYQFLVDIGLKPLKSKTLASLRVPEKYFMDFVRGYFDGDGCSFSYFDPIFKNSFRFYISFASAGLEYLLWLQRRLLRSVGIKGYISPYPGRPYYQLRYAKKESVVLSKRMYYRTSVPHLRRKYLKIQKALRTIAKSRSGEIGRHATLRL